MCSLLYHTKSKVGVWIIGNQISVAAQMFFKILKLPYMVFVIIN